MNASNRDRKEKSRSPGLKVFLASSGALRLVVHAIYAAALVENAGADKVARFTADWAKIRAQQPIGLSLKVILPRTSFYQGEVIPATLVFSNSSSSVYHVWDGNYDRSGRIQDIAFFGVDAKGDAVIDPLAWYFEQGLFYGGGLGDTEKLGEWRIALPANQWLRFDRSGRYRCYAWSNRPRS